MAVVILTSVLLVASADAAPLFGMADVSTLVVRGTVDKVTGYDAVQLQVFQVQVARVLKGDVAAGETIQLAQEMLFASTKPYFAVGTETLVLAVPLPSYSTFQQALPAGRYWRWTERLETAPDVAVLTDPALTEAVARYLAVREDTEATADFLVASLTGPNPRIRHDALIAISARREIPPLLDAGRLQPLSRWLRDASQPVTERAQVIVQLAHEGAPGVVDLAESLAATEGPLQAPAVDALVTMDKLPPAERLLTWSRSADEALRLVASRGLAKIGSPAALDRLAEMLAHETSGSVRLAIVQALGHVLGERSVELLATELTKSEKAITLAAAESLARLATHEAIVALRAALEHGSDDAQMAAAFALKRTNDREAEAILNELEATHPDPKVRRLCKLALGESMHEH